MVQPVSKSDLTSETDPSVAKQYDTKTPIDKQVDELYETIDRLSIGLLTTIRSDLGPVSRSMAVAKRAGPDILFLYNIHSKKHTDLSSNPTAQITFQDSTTQDWISLTGVATTFSNDDARIKDLYNPTVKAWFGDLGDGKHTGGPEDPRMGLIEIKAKYVTYWLHTVDKEGFEKEVGKASETGQVAQTGVTREIGEKDLEAARKKA
ncbi:uncharacterized protein KY384_008801 [Bacidia gigantensis]|uniref:uncharacterized protein n=1 Tax=Bacidia gigantensis TaxID=2732470 RepID=UPI001D056E1A|nr:uncharacterized protein KY384_008801 [Bacidia gigantensis]KAG8526600.1 hypothetical protein KY384_008801 [Bacidia gigantensis]